MSNPYQSPHHGPSSAEGIAAGFSVECDDCGRRLGVTSAMAGTQVACGCGRTVPVPRLSELRRMAGQEAYITNAVERARRLIADDHVPGDGLCIACGAPTRSTARYDVSCEQTCAVDATGLGSRMLLLGLALLAGSLWLMRIFYRIDDRDPVVHGRDTSIRLPVWLCDPCRADARWFKPRDARELLGRIETYAEVFREYPAASVERVRSES